MGEKWHVISTESCDFHAYTLGFFYLPQICDKQLYFPSEGRRAEDFFALKNPTASAGFEPANLGTKGQQATSRPPNVSWAISSRVNDEQRTYTTRMGQVLEVSVFGQSLIAREQLVNLFATIVSDFLYF